jgi:hypothetical protein
VASLPIEQRIIHYFLAMGAQHVPTQHEKESLLTFSLGNEKLFVSILSARDAVQRNRVLDTVLNLTSLRSTATLLYIVAPRLLGASLDAGVFRSQGIGLLLFDERRIEQAVKPEKLSPNIEQQTSTLTPDPTLLAEVASLRSLYSEMEKTLEKLSAELRSFKETAQERERVSDFVLESVKRSPPPIQAQPSGGSLPSFFSNNPWLEVLSKRGSLEASPLAG